MSHMTDIICVSVRCRIFRPAKRIRRKILTLLLGCLGFLVLAGFQSGRFWTISIHQEKNAYYILNKYSDSMVAVYPAEMKLLLRDLLYVETISRYPLNFSQNIMLIRNETAFMPLLKEMTKDIFQRLSDKAAEDYPMKINIKELSDQVLSNRSVPYAPINNFVPQYLINPKDTCNSTSVYILVLIKSAVKNYRLRQVIRRTWLTDIYSAFEEAKALFVLGNSELDSPMVKDENFVHRDILQGTFEDSYRNNTLKTMMVFKWITEYCRNARFLFFVDDDMFVNAKLVQKYLSSVREDMEKNLYSGIPAIANLPIRTKSKWRVSKKEYPFLIYPNYLSGCAMFLSQYTVRRFQSVFPFVAYFPFDDVYLGIVASKLGIRPQRNKFMFYDHAWNSSSAVHNMIARHGFQKPDVLYRAYKSFAMKMQDIDQ